MKGPFERLKYDLRRVWECPRCHHRERTPGTTTSCICRCQAKEEALKRVCMTLVEDGARRKKPPHEIKHETPSEVVTPVLEVAPVAAVAAIQQETVAPSESPAAPTEAPPATPEMPPPAMP